MVWIETTEQNNTVWEKTASAAAAEEEEEEHTAAGRISQRKTGADRGLIDVCFHVGHSRLKEAPKSNSKYQEKCQFHNTETVLTGMIVLLF